MSEFATIREWVKAAQSGEKTAWSFLYRQYYPGLYAIALKICKSIPIAQDMVQDSFMTAFLKLSQLKDAAAFGGWIKKILLHSYYRSSQQDHKINYLDISLQSESFWENELNQKLDLLSAQSSLYTSLALLPEVLRSTLLLRFFLPILPMKKLPPYYPFQLAP